jgi:peptidoglycan/xylan/chitin deacetylase (PgdA/CDA1 family)
VLPGVQTKFTIVLHSRSSKPLFNPLLIAAKGKGLLPMMERGRVIASRYGFTPRKMDKTFAVLMDTLSQYACPATIPVTASALASNPKLAHMYSHQGLELAIHGLHHVDYSLLSLERQLNHLRQAREIFQRLGAPVTGFRCPYLRWNVDTLTALKETGFTYDSSQALDMDVVEDLSTDAYRRALDFYRAQSANSYPALPGWSGNLIRIPYCLPDDEALVDRLHITDESVMADIWLAMLERAYQAGELFTLGLHPERASVCLAAMQAVLVKAHSLSPGVWIARLDEIAAWFRSLGETNFELHPESSNLFHVKISAPNRATVLVRAAEIMADKQPWIGEFHVVSTNAFTLRSDKRPLVGLSPGSPIALQRFLRHQGYLVEVSADSQAYAVYLDRRAFQAEDELPLLAGLERGDWPLVRLSRWPDAARCGLAITGDLDAFTIWDFGRRILAS